MRNHEKEDAFCGHFSHTSPWRDFVLDAEDTRALPVVHYFKAVQIHLGEFALQHFSQFYFEKRRLVIGDP